MLPQVPGHLQSKCRPSRLPLLGASASHRLLGPHYLSNPSTLHPRPCPTNAARPHCRALEAAPLLPVGLLPLPKAKGIATSAEGRTRYLEGGRASASSCLSSRMRQGAAGPRWATPHAEAVRMRTAPCQGGAHALQARSLSESALRWTLGKDQAGVNRWAWSRAHGAGDLEPDGKAGELDYMWAEAPSLQSMLRLTKLKFKEKAIQNSSAEH